MGPSFIDGGPKKPVPTWAKAIALMDRLGTAGGAVMSDEERLCPLQTDPHNNPMLVCRREKCKWWVQLGDESTCAVSAIAIALMVAHLT